MDGADPYVASEEQLHAGGYSAEHAAYQWQCSQGYGGPPYGMAPGVGGFGGTGSAFPYGFDPSVPPPPFVCPPSGPFPNIAPPASLSPYSGRGPPTFHRFNQQFRNNPAMQYGPESSQQQQQEYEDSTNSGIPQEKIQDHRLGSRVKDESVSQSKQDQQWLRRFLQNRETRNQEKSQQQQQQQQHTCVHTLKQALYQAAHLVSQLVQSSETLRNSADSGSAWAESYSAALDVKAELLDKLAALKSLCSDNGKAKVFRLAKRRARRLRARRLQKMEDQRVEERAAEKEAAIDKWRLQQIRQVEERKKELELKLAADSVLCEVRKKQADVKRMQDVLRSLEKLRKLRKEAAFMKGILTEPECEEVFSSRLVQLRCVLQRRTAVYSAEEKALMVMLEGEQEEERRREHEKRVMKEREGQLQRKWRVEAMLFGAGLTADSGLQPFTECYAQAEHSLHGLLQIRRQWDAFLAADDHPDSSPVPQNWILPDFPSDQIWASALHASSD